MNRTDIPPFVAGLILGLIIMFFGVLAVANDNYKRGQTDALYGHWKYVKVKDAAGNEYVVKTPAEKR